MFRTHKYINYKNKGEKNWKINQGQAQILVLEN